MAENILSEIKKSELNKFKKDFLMLLKVAVGIDKEYARGTTPNKDIKKYKEIVQLFNEKYSLKLKIDKTPEYIRLVVVFPEKSIKDFVTNVASRIPGLVSLGINNFNEIEFAQAEKLLDKAKEKICLTYYSPETGTTNIYFEFNDGVEILYDKSITQEINPQFLLCAYYALKQGIKKDNDVYNVAGSFGFMNIINFKEEKEWLDKFNPYFGE